MGDFKKAEPSLALDVDVLILDYLLYNATSEFLEVSELCALDDNSEDALSACNEHITMVNTWLDIFHHHHVDVQTSPSLHFRLLLLKLTALFTGRKHHTLTTPSSTVLTFLRQSSKSRARMWRQHAPDTAYDEPALERFVARIAAVRDQAPNKDHSSSPSPQLTQAKQDDEELPTLLDLLPLFIELTAARAHMGDLTPAPGQVDNSDHGFTVTQGWFELVARLMEEACVEQYKLHGATTSAPILEAFAWGLVDAELEVISTNHPRETQEVDQDGDENMEEVLDRTTNTNTQEGEASSRGEKPSTKGNSPAFASTPTPTPTHGTTTTSPSSLNKIFAIPRASHRHDSSSPSSTPLLSIKPTVHDPHALWSTIRAAALHSLLSSPPRTFQTAVSAPEPASLPSANTQWLTHWDVKTGKEVVEIISSKETAEGNMETGDRSHNDDGDDDSDDADVETDVLGFLRGLLESHAKPVLVQLEKAGVGLGDGGKGGEEEEEEDGDLGAEGRPERAQMRMGDVDVEGVWLLERREVELLWRIAGFEA